MEDTLKGWFAEFHTYLVYDNPALAEKDTDKETAIDAVKAAVCQNINLFMEQNEEEFKDYLTTFVQDVWTLLVAVKQGSGQVVLPAGQDCAKSFSCMAATLTMLLLNPQALCHLCVRPCQHVCRQQFMRLACSYDWHLVELQDNLAMNAICFLTTVANGVHHELFKNEGALKQVCEKIVIPNLTMRESDEEMFELNWVEYVRRDTEGSDSDTRRRAAAELVKSLTAKFPNEASIFIFAAVSVDITTMLELSYNWPVGMEYLGYPHDGVNIQGCTGRTV